MPARAICNRSATIAASTSAKAGDMASRTPSDLMLQLAVNPRTTKAQLDQMLAAIATQVAPAGEHFYIYGEGDRLAQAVFYIAKRKLHTADEWRKWFEQVAAPAPLAKLARCVDLAARHRQAPQHDGSSSRRCTCTCARAARSFRSWCCRRSSRRSSRCCKSRAAPDYARRRRACRSPATCRCASPRCRRSAA